MQIILSNRDGLVKWVAHLIFRYSGSISDFDFKFFNILTVYFLFHGAVCVLVSVLTISFLEGILDIHHLLKNYYGDKCVFV